MRFFVCSGTDRAAEELFRTAETVLGVSPTRSATDLSVTAGFFLPPVFFLTDFTRQISSSDIAPHVPERMRSLLRSDTGLYRRGGCNLQETFLLCSPIRISIFFILTTIAVW